MDSGTTGRRSSYADDAVDTLAKTTLLVRERGGGGRWETGASKRKDGGEDAVVGYGARGHGPISRGAREEPLIPLLAATPPVEMPSQLGNNQPACDRIAAFLRPNSTQIPASATGAVCGRQ